METARGEAMMSRRINLEWIGIDGEIYTFMPKWIGKILCHLKKEHEWELLGEYCSRCYLDSKL
jgi:hypothetical protein